jgi:hypothetical protein
MQVLGTPRNGNGTGVMGARMCPRGARGCHPEPSIAGPAFCRWRTGSARQQNDAYHPAFASGGRQWRLARIHHHGCSGVVSWGFLVWKGSLKDEGGGTLLFW